MHTVVETHSYLVAADGTGMPPKERAEIVTLVANEPQSGVIMSGTGGCRKFRVAGRGKGKSGGYRVVTAYGGGDIPVFLLTVFGKDEKDNLSKAERNDLAALAKVLFDSYSKWRQYNAYDRV